MESKNKIHTEEKTERIFFLIKKKNTKSQIAKKLGISTINVEYHIKTLIKEGRIQEDEIEKGTNQPSEDTIDKSSPEYLKKREQIVECLKKGWKNPYIRKVLGINSYETEIYIKDIKRKKIMTSEEIKEARERKRQEDLKFVANSINNDGLNGKQIRELKPEFAFNEVTSIIKELICVGIVTREKIEENRKNSFRRIMNKDAKMSIEEQESYVLDKVRKGYNSKEITESDTTKTLTKNKVINLKKQLIAIGKITQKEADEAIQKRQKEILNKKHNKVINKIKKYTELGYNLKEMSKFITEYSYSHLGKIRNNYITQNGWYTQKQLERYVSLRNAGGEKYYKKMYKLFKQEAKKEDELELEGEIDIPTQGREMLIEVLINLDNLKIDISNEDIQIVLNTFYMYPKLANKDSIRLIISNTIKNEGIQSIEMKAIELRDILRDTKFYKPLEEYSRWARKLKLLPKMQDMKKNGMNNSKISEKLGISSSEVSIILNNAEDHIFEGLEIGDE